MKDRLKHCRVSAKFSQKYVAISVGVATPTVSQWESGAKSPTLENIIKLADLYGTSVDYLIGRGDQTKPVQPSPRLSEYDRQLITYTRRLNAQGMEKILDYARDLSENDRYTKEKHARKAE